MVKIGFICEGKTEALFLSSEKFSQFLSSRELEVAGVLDARGSGNLLPHQIFQYIQLLENKGAQKIIILTDLDEDACITITKERIKARQEDIVVVAVRQIEAWFLAGTTIMRKLLNDSEFEFKLPESEPNPFEAIRNLMIEKTGRGIYKGVGGKIKLVNILVRLGLDISEVAMHPNCPSALYLVKKLNELNG